MAFFGFRYMDYIFGNETEARTFARVHGWEVIGACCQNFKILKTFFFSIVTCLSCLHWPDWWRWGNSSEAFPVAQSIRDTQEDCRHYPGCRSCGCCWEWEGEEVSCDVVAERKTCWYQWSRYEIFYVFLKEL